MCLKDSTEAAAFTLAGSEFHNTAPLHERDFFLYWRWALGSCSPPCALSRVLWEWTPLSSVNRPEMWGGDIPFNALKTSTALFLLRMSTTGIHPSVCIMVSLDNPTCPVLEFLQFVYVNLATLVPGSPSPLRFRYTHINKKPTNYHIIVYFLPQKWPQTI